MFEIGEKVRYGEDIGEVVYDPMQSSQTILVDFNGLTVRFYKDGKPAGWGSGMVLKTQLRKVEEPYEHP